jgi:hypothetical protein
VANFKSNLTKLAAVVIEDALKPDVALDIRIAALKAVTPVYLGESRIKAQLRIKGIDEDDDDGRGKVADFRKIRDRVRKAS